MMDCQMRHTAAEMSRLSAVIKEAAALRRPLHISRSQPSLPGKWGRLAAFSSSPGLIRPCRTLLGERGRLLAVSPNSGVTREVLEPRCYARGRYAQGLSSGEGKRLVAFSSSPRTGKPGRTRLHSWGSPRTTREVLEPSARRRSRASSSAVSAAAFFSTSPGPSASSSFAADAAAQGVHVSSEGSGVSEAQASKGGASASRPLDGAVVALGKFDALHIGHRSLALHAAAIGPPCMLSFDHMAQVLKWEPRLPLVAPCDRPRVLRSWADEFDLPHAPREHRLDFRDIRSLQPEEFVQLLAREGVKGVVAGANYRFGYRAAGDAEDLTRLCTKHGMAVQIVQIVDALLEETQVCKTTHSLEPLIHPNAAPSTSDNLPSGGPVPTPAMTQLPSDQPPSLSSGNTNGTPQAGADRALVVGPSGAQPEKASGVPQVRASVVLSEGGVNVSSTRVREALADGDLSTVRALLDRNYRVFLGQIGGTPLVLGALLQASRPTLEGPGGWPVLALGGGGLLNQPPKDGKYSCLVSFMQLATETEDYGGPNDPKPWRGTAVFSSDGVQVTVGIPSEVEMPLQSTGWLALDLLPLD